MLIFAAIAVTAVPCKAQDDGGEITYNNIGLASSSLILSIPNLSYLTLALTEGLAFVNMAVLLTTENYPDVLHDTLDASIINSNSSASVSPEFRGTVQWRYVWFYVAFLLIGIFIVANMMLAIIWDIYKKQYV